MGFQLVEFEEHGKQTEEYKFQVANTAEDSCYDIITSNNLLWNIGIDI